MFSTKRIAAAVVVFGVGVAWASAQDKKPDPPAPDPNLLVPRTPDADVVTPMEGLDRVPTEFPDIPRLPKPDWKIADRMPKVLPTDDAPTRVRKRKLLAAYAEFFHRTRPTLFNSCSEMEAYTSHTIDASRAVVAMAAELWDKPADLRPWLEWRVAAAKDHERKMRERAEGGLVRPVDLCVAVRDRLDAELALLKLPPAR